MTNVIKRKKGKAEEKGNFTSLRKSIIAVIKV